MNRAELDDIRMGEALALAQRVMGQTEPNPRVGCVIGSEDGTVLGSGATQHAGGHHAEVMALHDALARGLDVAGATAWVTLEPCAHHGRTPPCCEALIRAGLQRVVVAVQDPFPQVAGTGIARLRAAGIQVDLAGAARADEAWQINIGFFSRMLRGRPWLRMKVASSLDGRTGLDNGVSQWITGEAARADGHAWRKRASAVLTGVGTVLADDPRLDARLAGSIFNPLRVVVDSKLRTPPHARLLAPPGRTLIVTAESADDSPGTEVQLPAEIIRLPGADGNVDLQALCSELARRQVNELHVEAGPRLCTALLQAGLVDELLLYLSPRLLGGGRGLVDWPALQRLDQGMEFQIVETAAIRDDLRIRLRVAATPLFRPGAPTDSVGRLYKPPTA